MQLFFVGNKRSGTSLLVRRLNRHSKIFVSHESDILWLLWHWHNKKKLKDYKYDTPQDKHHTMELLGKICGRDVHEAFHNSLQKIMEKGTRWTKPEPSKCPVWWGDKKPNQQLDPMIVDFTDNHFPTATYIHMVRHPMDFIRSVKGQHKKLACFGTKKKDILEFWVSVEQQVIEFKKNHKVLTILYKDLCCNQEEVMGGIFTELKLDMEGEYGPSKVRTYDRPKGFLTDSALELVERYGL